MKKITLTLAVLLFTTLGFSQKFHFGIRGGANLANQGGGSDEETVDYKTRTSFHAGLVGELSLAEKFSLQGELLYNSLGTKSDDIDNSNGFTLDTQGELKTDYISLPIMAKYYVFDGLSAELGPQFSYLLSSDYDISVSDNQGNSDSLSADLKEDTKKLDIGLAIGAQYKLDFGLFFGVRYVLGLTKIYEDVVVIEDGATQVIAAGIERKNRVFQASIGYFFN